MDEHPVKQHIIGFEFSGAMGINTYEVGLHGVTRIEACTKSGLHANIPYVRVWVGDVCEAEFCQHHLLGVFFGSVIDDDV